MREEKDWARGEERKGERGMGEERRGRGGGKQDSEKMKK